MLCGGWRWNRTVTANCQKHCAKLCEFCVDAIASSSRAAVSYYRLTEAGFDFFPARIGRFVDASPNEESLVSHDVGESAVRSQGAWRDRDPATFAAFE